MSYPQLVHKKLPNSRILGGSKILGIFMKGNVSGVRMAKKQPKICHYLPKTVNLRHQNQIHTPLNGILFTTYPHRQKFLKRSDKHAIRRTIQSDLTQRVG